MSDKLTWQDWRLIKDMVSDSDLDDRERLATAFTDMQYEYERRGQLIDSYRVVLKHEMR